MKLVVVGILVADIVAAVGGGVAVVAAGTVRVKVMVEVAMMMVNVEVIFDMIVLVMV